MKIGDYVRTKKGEIHQILDEEIDIRFRFDMGTNYPFWKNGEYDNYILKSSPNIIDLIEVGDYVNGLEVEDIYIGEIKYVVVTVNEAEYLFNEDIGSIVTKEQFASMEYRIGDK